MAAKKKHQPFKKGQDPRLCGKAKENLEKLQPDQLQDGVCGSKKKEAVPNFIQVDCEDVIQGQNNTWIVLGRDRPTGRCSGYGGQGDSQAGTIDIVVGRMGAQVVECVKSGPEGQDLKEEQYVWVDPIFSKDASRIYISQKTDVDLNFKLAAGTIGSPGWNKGDTITAVNQTKKHPMAAIAMKSDAIRIIAKEGIKLVTMGANQINAQGGKFRSVQGVDIIAGNQSAHKEFRIQPMVKGDNLVDCLSALGDKVDQLTGIVQSFLEAQHKYNETLATHYHHSPFWGVQTKAGGALIYDGTQVMKKFVNQVQRSIENEKKNIQGWKNNYLFQNGGRYINSRHNNVN